MIARHLAWPVTGWGVGAPAYRLPDGSQGRQVGGPFLLCRRTGPHR